MATWKTALTALVCVCEVVCTESPRKRARREKVCLEFSVPVEEYDMDVIADFVTLKEAVDMWGGTRAVSERVVVPVSMRVGVFERIVDMCREEPRNREDVGRDELYEILRGVEYLNISDGEEKKGRRFFRNLAERSLLGRHTDDIVGSTGGEGRSILGNTYIRLLGGLVAARGMEMRVLGTAATILKPCSNYENMRHGDLEAADFVSFLTGIKIVWSQWYRSTGNNSTVMDTDILKTVGWLAKNMPEIASLDVGWFILKMEHIKMMAEMRLTELDVYMCNLPNGAISMLIQGDSNLKNTLANLTVSELYHLSAEDRAAMASLGLEELRMNSCLSRAGDLALMLEGTALGRSLRRLYVNEERMGAEDLRAIGRLTGLEELVGTVNDHMQKDGISAFVAEGPASRDTLRVLSIPRSRVRRRDIEAISTMTKLENLNMRTCTDVPEGSIAVLLGGELRKTLRHLDLTDIALAQDDVRAISMIEQMQSLQAASCSIPRGSLELLVQGGCGFRNTLQVLDISANDDLGPEDMKAISRMEHLRELLCDANSTDGHIACLVGDESSALRKSLQKLSINRRGVSLQDMKALSTLGLVELTMFFTKIPHGGLSELVKGELRRSLERLSLIGCKMVLEADMEAIAGFEELKSLNITGCNIAPGSLELLVQDGCRLRSTLLSLDISSNNRLGSRNMAALSRMESLEVLRICSCHGISPGDFAALVGSEDSALRKSLRVLDVILNKLAVVDIEALCKLGLTQLFTSRCGLESESFVLIAGSAVLGKTLRVLGLSWDSLKEEDRDVLARMERLQLVFCW